MQQYHVGNPYLLLQPVDGLLCSYWSYYLLLIIYLLVACIEAMAFHTCGHCILLSLTLPCK